MANTEKYRKTVGGYKILADRAICDENGRSLAIHLDKDGQIDSIGGKEFFARMAENSKNDGEGNEISQTYATKDVMTGATAQANGKAGLVPAPLIADKDKYLKGDGTWNTINALPSSTSIDFEKVLSVNQAGSAEWAQHSWTSASKNIPSESVIIGGRKYPTVQIGNQLWITKNLDWKFDGLVVDGNAGVSNTSAAWYPNRDEATYGWDGAGYGLLYNAYAARYMNDNNLLPAGWRAPSQEDWVTLITTVSTTGPGAIENNAGLKLKATSVGGTDDYGFSMLLPGMLQSNGFFNGIGSYVANLALFGTSNVYYVNTNATFNYLNYAATGDLGAGYSIRLVKDVV